MKKLLHIIHWIGFLITCFMLIASALDKSRDEIIIHLTASMIPISLTWLIAYFIGGPRKFFPFLIKNNTIKEKAPVRRLFFCSYIIKILQNIPSTKGITFCISKTNIIESINNKSFSSTPHFY